MNGSSPTLQIVLQYLEVELHDPSSSVISNVLSHRVYMTQFIPQENIIGCILFLIIIKCLPKALNLTSILFADNLLVVFLCLNEKV